MNKGRIIWYSEFKGYGYISHDDGREIYFHCTSLDSSQSATAGSTVRFEIFETKIGLEATRIEAA